VSMVRVFAAALLLVSASCSASNKTTTTPTRPTIPTTPGRTPSISISQPFTDSAKPKLAFAGDSITFQSVADINAHYRNRYNVAIVASNGVDTYFAARFVAEQAAQAPAVEVINLGTNDANLIRYPFWSEPKLTIASIGRRLDIFSKEFPRTTCVVFVTVNSHNRSWSQIAAAINRHIRRFSHVADWDKAWRAGYFDRPDDPHPNAVGRQALLQIEDEAIAKCPR
jgi:hypothetical protein